MCSLVLTKKSQQYTTNYVEYRHVLLQIESAYGDYRF
jgi:hypothetical protein